MTQIDGSCDVCIHYTHWFTCKAFPDGIPEAISYGERHDKPYPGDNGIQFEKRPPTEREKQDADTLG